MARINPTKAEVDFGVDGKHVNASFDSETALDMRRIVTQKIDSLIAKPGILFRGNGLHWYDDDDTARDIELTRLTAAGVPVFIPVIPDDPPDVDGVLVEGGK